MPSSQVVFLTAHQFDSLEVIVKPQNISHATFAKYAKFYFGSSKNFAGAPKEFPFEHIFSAACLRRNANALDSPF